MHLIRNFLLFLVASYTAAQAPALTELSSRITANTLKADVSFLASDALEGRGTPSRGLDIAAEFIAAQLRRAGLEPAGDDGYFQTASLERITPNTDGLALTVETGGQTIKADRATIAILAAAPLDLTYAAAFKVPPDRPSLNSLTPEGVGGKVLVFSARSPRPSAELRVKLRPALVINVLEPAFAPTERAVPQLREPDGPQIPMLLVWDAGVRKSLAEAKPGPVEATVSAHMSAPAVTPVKVRNVVAILRGADPVLKDTYVLLTAHYDHLGILGSGSGDRIFNGANDDASGTASVIEIAGSLAALPRPRRSIVFVMFFGEEMSELGSQYYVRHPVFPISRTIADINLEQLGRTDDSSGPHVGMFNLTGFGFTDLAGVFRKAGAEAGIQVVKDENNSDRYFTASDNYPFANAGVPSTTISVSYMFPDYHGVGDEWPKLDYENMAKVDRAIALGIKALADSTAEPQWNAANPAVKRFVKVR
jgi:hypothetical protein